LAVRTWHSHPLYAAVVEILERKGPLTDLELYDLLKSKYENLGFSSFNKTLMQMEIEGKVYVFTLARGKRRVELMKDK
jgi:Fe2+ or Zn2+ uptake regulation protein